MKAVRVALLCAGAVGLSPVLAQDATAPASDAAIEDGSCTGGSESTLSIYRLNYLKKNTQNLPLKNGKQPQ